MEMKVIWTEAADHDREAILDLIAEEDLQAALRMDELFKNAARRLSAFPGMGRPGRMAGTGSHRDRAGPSSRTTP